MFYFRCIIVRLFRMIQYRRLLCFKVGIGLFHKEKVTESDVLKSGFICYWLVRFTVCLSIFFLQMNCQAVLKTNIHCGSLVSCVAYELFHYIKKQSQRHAEIGISSLIWCWLGFTLYQYSCFYCFSSSTVGCFKASALC